MTDYDALVEDAPQREDIDFLDSEINGYNMAATGRADGQWLAVFLREENGEIFGGLYGWTWASWLEVRYLWVRNDRRGREHGRRLLQTAEGEAIARGCGWALLDTYSFQAPDFYRKVGYEAFGVLPDCPPSHTRYFMRKRLAPR